MNSQWKVSRTNFIVGIGSGGKELYEIKRGVKNSGRLCNILNEINKK